MKSEEETLYEDQPQIGEKIGELTIPKLDRSLPIFHGTNKEVLKNGVITLNTVSYQARIIFDSFWS